MSESFYLVPVSIEDQQTGIISGLAGLQSLNSLSQFILNHLQISKQREKTLAQLPLSVQKKM